MELDEARFKKALKKLLAGEKKFIRALARKKDIPLHFRKMAKKGKF